MTRETLNERLNLLQREREQAIAAVGTYDGAIAQVRWSLAQMDAEEAAKNAAPVEVPAKKRRGPPQCQGRGCNKRKAELDPVTVADELQRRMDGAGQTEVV